MLNTDKNYQLQKGEKGILLIVRESAASGVKIEQLFFELKQRNIIYEAEDIRKLWAEASGNPEEIAPLEKVQNYDYLLDLQVSKDKMRAILKIYPALIEKPLKKEMIYSFLREKGIAFGLKEELLPEILKSRENYSEWLIAEGKPSVNGIDAHLEFYFQKEDPSLKPQELENGRVDFYNLDLIQIVEAGTVLVERIPPTTGTNGHNVLGGEIKARPGKDLRLPLGVNTEITEDDTKLVAKITGHVCFVHRKVNVYPTYEVKGNVDFNTGNIKFPGNVIVRGSVLNTFMVEAEGDVEIYGNLGGTVIAGGNLQIRKGIVQGKADVKGNIYTRYIENAETYSQASIFVGEAILHSTVKAVEKIEVAGRRGLIAGGRITAGKEVSAKNIGAPMGTTTILEVGYAPDLIDEYKAVCTQMTYLSKDMEKNIKIINTLEKMKQEGNYSRQKQILHSQVLQTQNKNKLELSELQERKNDLESCFGDLKEARVKVLETIYCGVVLNMGKHTVHIDEEKRRTVFRLEDYEIRGFSM